MKMYIYFCLLISMLPVLLPVVAFADPFDELARDFWKWRISNQPLSYDDIPRVDRPVDWVTDWSAATVAKRRQALVEFERRWKQIDPSGWTPGRQVDHRLIGSAVARVRWEMEVERGWRRDPRFYIYQTVGEV